MVEIGRLFWKKVVAADNFTIGEIESAELDTKTWQVNSFYVSLNDEATKRMGFERPYFGKVFICLPVDTVKDVGDFIVLNKTLSKLMELKECKK